LQAKAICRDCPAEHTCLLWALHHRETGVWGATDEAERWQLAPDIYHDARPDDEPMLPLFVKAIGA